MQEPLHATDLRPCSGADSRTVIGPVELREIEASEADAEI